MFSATLIVFRETLEAAMFIGIIAAATKQLAGRTRWLGAGVAVGALGAIALALAADRFSDWYGGFGQDLVNITILSTALAMLVWHCVWVSTHGKELAADARSLGVAVGRGDRKPWALFLAVAMAVLREGAETVLFVGGTMAGSGTGNSMSTLLACAAGLVAGAFVGVLIYAGLSRIPVRHLFTATNLLVALLAASIASQLAKALAQAGVLEQWSSPLWNSSALLAQDSAVGTVLHALMGYDARPSGAQLAFYAGVLMLIYAGSRLAPRRAAALPHPAVSTGA